MLVTHRLKFQYSFALNGNRSLPPGASRIVILPKRDARNKVYKSCRSWASISSGHCMGNKRDRNCCTHTTSRSHVLMRFPDPRSKPIASNVIERQFRCALGELLTRIRTAIIRVDSLELKCWQHLWTLWNFVPASNSDVRQHRRMNCSQQCPGALWSKEQSAQISQSNVVLNRNFETGCQK